jgi:hypothetical protein
MSVLRVPVPAATAARALRLGLAEMPSRKAHTRPICRQGHQLLRGALWSPVASGRVEARGYAGHEGKRPRATTEREPWEADPSWHPARRGAFECYRDMGPERSTAKVARAWGKSNTLMETGVDENGRCDRPQQNLVATVSAERWQQIRPPIARPGDAS